MDFIKDEPKSLYRKFLAASIGSALSMSVYTLVDTICIGQSEGPLGTAATAVTSIMFGFTIFIALLCGIGGSVMMTATKAYGDEKKGNSFYTLASITVAALILVIWLTLALFPQEIFTFLGAREKDTLEMVMRYAKYMVWFWPLFVLPTFLGCFIRNDGAPKVVTFAVLTGGCLNIIGDYVLCFPMGMGIEGAAIATVSSLSIQTIIMLSYLFTKKCKLKFVKPQEAGHSLKTILSIGFGSSLIEIGTVIPAIVINLQIVKYDPTGSAFAIYGMLATITALFQTLFSGVGQTVQPLVSANYGASQPERIKDFLRYATKTVFIFGGVFMLIGILFPNQLINIFMTDVTPEITAMASTALRLYFPAYLCYGGSVMAIYYLQSIMKEKSAILVSALRSVFVNLSLLFALPVIMGVNGIWLAVAITELVVGACAVIYIRKTKIVLGLGYSDVHEEYVPEAEPISGVRIVTVSRESGSGGREVGKQLADALGFAYYDGEILSVLAEKSATDDQYIDRAVKSNESKQMPVTFSRTLVNSALMDLLPQQQAVIKQVAQKGDCVFVGRNADLILHDFYPLKIFVYADMAAKLERWRQRGSAEEKMSDSDLEKRINEIDRQRAAGHDLVATIPWGDKRGYHLCVDTTNVRIKEIVPVLAEYTHKWFAQK